MPAERRVYVTGMGAACCLGCGVAQFWSALLKGACGLRPIERFELEGSPFVTGGEVSGFEPEPLEKSGASMGAQMAARAALEAAAGLPESAREGLSVVLSTNFGPAEAIEMLLDGRLETPAGKAQAGRLLRQGPFEWDVEHVARAVGAGGERANISLSCSSGNAALAHALALIRTGRTELALVGGYDSIQKITWAGLAALRIMVQADAPRVRPFDKNRSGTLFSEGAGMLLIESERHAEGRGATPLAQVAGAGTNNNAHHMTHADTEGVGTAEAITMALTDAGIPPEAIGHVNAHGTGTKLNDAIETRALRRVFAGRAGSIPVTSIKGALGHAMGAASALEAVACVMTLREGLIPATLNYETPDPDCNLDVVRDAPREVELAAVLNNSAGIGGGNAAIVLTNVAQGKETTANG